MDQAFKRAVAVVLRYEGGYVNDPDDPGGETKFGISRRSYPHLEIESITVEQAIEIYRRDWWRRYRYGEIVRPAIAAKVFVLAVNIGPKGAGAILQRASNRSGGDWLDADGAIGDLTIRAVNRHPEPEWLKAEFDLGAIGYYLRLGNDKYLRGWIRRAMERP